MTLSFYRCVKNLMKNIDKRKTAKYIYTFLVLLQILHLPLEVPLFWIPLCQLYNQPGFDEQAFELQFRYLNHDRTFLPKRVSYINTICKTHTLVLLYTGILQQQTPIDQVTKYFVIQLLNYKLNVEEWQLTADSSIMGKTSDMTSHTVPSSAATVRMLKKISRTCFKNEHLHLYLPNLQ